MPAGGNYIYSFPVSRCEEVGDESELGNTWEDRYVQTFVNQLVSVFAGQKQAGRFNDTKHKGGRWVLAVKGMMNTCVHADTLNMDFLGPGSKVLIAE